MDNESSELFSHLADWTSEYGKVYGLHQGLRPTLVISDVDILNEIFMTKSSCFKDKHVSDYRCIIKIKRTIIFVLSY